MKSTEELLRKSHLERKSRMCKPGGLQKGNTSPALDDAWVCIHEWEREKDLVNEPVPACECALRGYKVCSCLCVCVSGVRWGQRSQPADASEASRAGSQDGCSQTLIRKTHHTAFPVFTTLRAFLTITVSVTSHYQLHLITGNETSDKSLSLHNICCVANLMNQDYSPPYLIKSHRSERVCVSSLLLYVYKDLRHNGKVCTCLGTPQLTYFIWTELHCVFIGATPHIP